MSVIGVGEFDRILLSEAKSIANRIRGLDGIESLDLSSPTAMGPDSVQAKQDLYGTPKYQNFASLPHSLSMILPNLREIDLSNAPVLTKRKTEFMFRCQSLEKLTWNNCRGISVRGEQIPISENLKEIYMDGSVFENHGNQPFYSSLNGFRALYVF